MKVCKTCRVCKPISCFYQSKTGRYGVQSHCIECRLLKASEYRKTEAGKESKKRYYQSSKGRERNVKYLREYNSSERVRKKRLEKLNWIREKAKANRERLSGGYVKHVIITLSGRVLNAGDIPDSLVDTKRQSIFLKRILKQKNEQHDTSNI